MVYYKFGVIKVLYVSYMLLISDESICMVR